MNAADIMTPDVITVAPDAPLDQVVALMLNHGVSGIPVMDGDSLAGIITEGDLLRRVELGTEPHRSHLREALAAATPLAVEYARSHGRKTSEVMTADVVTVTVETSLAEIVQLMESRRIKRVPVLRDGKLAGIISRANLLRALASRLHAPVPRVPDDDRIRTVLLHELRQHKWGAWVSQLDVTVLHGVITLRGVVSSEEQRVAVRVAAENVPGVQRVEDQLEDASAGAMSTLL